MSKQSRLLVVDASVMRAAGERGNEHAGFCIRVLQDIMQICHRVAISEDIKAEWNKHQSIEAIKWRRRMRTKKKLIPLDVGDQSVALQSQVSALENQVNGKVPDQDARKKAALRKDLHLLAATAVADGVLITNDKKLKALCERYQISTWLEWLHPIAEQDGSGHRDQCQARLKDLSNSGPSPPLPRRP